MAFWPCRPSTADGPLTRRIEFLLQALLNHLMVAHQYDSPAELRRRRLRSSRHEISKNGDQFFLIVFTSCLLDELRDEVVILGALSVLALSDLHRDELIPRVSLRGHSCQLLAVRWQVHRQGEDVKERIQAVNQFTHLSS